MGKFSFKGKRIQAYGKSHHNGQTGTVVADFGMYLLVKVDDESYPKASNNSGREGKYIQVDSLLAKVIDNDKT